MNLEPNEPYEPDLRHSPWPRLRRVTLRIGSWTLPTPVVGPPGSAATAAVPTSMLPACAATFGDGQNPPVTLNFLESTTPTTCRIALTARAAMLSCTLGFWTAGVGDAIGDRVEEGPADRRRAGGLGDRPVEQVVHAGDDQEEDGKVEVTRRHQGGRVFELILPNQNLRSLSGNVESGDVRHLAPVFRHKGEFQAFGIDTHVPAHPPVDRPAIGLGFLVGVGKARR